MGNTKVIVTFFKIMICQIWHHLKHASLFMIKLDCTSFGVTDNDLPLN